MKITQLFTRKNANEGVAIPVIISEGKDPIGTIKIVGRDGEVFKNAMRLRTIENARILTLPEDEQKEAISKADLELVASCVLSWSFEDECNKESVLNLLSESPFIFELVNQSVMNRSLFMDL
jgi:hypothetical protein